jgi:hypothetical protein
MIEWHFDVGPVSLAMLAAVIRGVYLLGQLTKWKEHTDERIGGVERRTRRTAGRVRRLEEQAPRAANV